MTYTLGEAAKATGVSKMTIQRALKSGRISGQKGETGAFALDPAEVHRVFPAVTASDSNTPVTVGRSATVEGDTELRVAHARLEAENAVLKAMLDDMRTERDRWHEQAQRLAIAAPTTPDVVVRPGGGLRAWWRQRAG